MTHFIELTYAGTSRSLIVNVSHIVSIEDRQGDAGSVVRLIHHTGGGFAVNQSVEAIRSKINVEAVQ